MRKWIYQQLNRPRLLGGLTLAVLCCILLAGLLPYNPLWSRQHWMNYDHGFRFVLIPPNEVSWLPNKNGLHFGDYGSIFSLGEFAPNGSGKENAASIELWLEPAATEDNNSILVFYTNQNPLGLNIGQAGDALILSRAIPEENGKLKTTSVRMDHVFRKGQELLITVTSGPESSSIYLNGTLVGSTPRLRFTFHDFVGNLVVGNSPRRIYTWGGTLRGIALSGEELTPEQVLRRYGIWSSNSEFADTEAQNMVALYRFEERQGTVVHDLSGHSPNLGIPGHFKIGQQPFLTPPWVEYEPGWDYWTDFLINIVGFIPLGFFLSAYLACARGYRRAALMATFFGAIVSLIIEVSQGFMPLRNSGTTDLITNTLGTYLGSLLFAWRPISQIFSLKRTKHLL